MGLDIRILANKEGHEEKNIGVWKDNYTLLSHLEYLADPIIDKGESEGNDIEIPLTTENLFDLERDLRHHIADTYYTPTELKDIEVLEYGHFTWSGTALTKDSAEWKWLHKARWMIENGWKISVWWWY